ncbi:substrate-binding periplasmic protein [Spartinivicinus poritis]|uniref:ABC transporter substrate-binding protein n=1 Tax=Spartinivicinus poritis TaxID=2994640 RepID=A0ABT5UEA1_9GAMM|nr:ABC transporter substrate-binding protein [Spartinivicinus sp. A2-2]MDE1464642.1 ABC transporter substrate-binding protein [Spartinivicinus sp. A2-2]
MVFFPWKRGLEFAKNGSWDGAVGWAKRKEREKYFYYSDPIYYTKWVFFHLKEVDFNWQRIDDLKSYRIRAMIGNSFTPSFDAAEKAGDLLVERVATESQNIKMLLMRRIDTFPLELNICFYLMQTKYRPTEVVNITYHPKPLMSEPNFLLLNKKAEKNRNIMVQFNKGLAALKKSGKYDLYFTEFRQGRFFNN